MVVARFQGRVVFCQDVPGTAELYEKLLGFRRGQEDGEDISMHAPVADGSEATIEIYLHPTVEAKPDHLGRFEVDNVNDAVEELSAHRWVVAASPADTPWDVREATVTDPNGHTLTLTGPTSTSGDGSG